MQKLLYLLLVLGTIVGCFSAKPRPRGSDTLWQSWDDVKMLAAKEPKPILIDIYTDWCIYCKKMDATTYRNDSVTNFLKNNFYRFKFNAEGKDTITWQDKKFTFNPRYDVHDFAVYLTRGSIVYPTTVIITPGGQPYYQHGELKPADIELLLRYFSSPSQKQISLEQYAKSFTPMWK